MFHVEHFLRIKQIMNILITGATSKTAEAITRILYAETDWNIHLLSSAFVFKNSSYRIKSSVVNYFDLPALKKTIYNIKPDVIINCAALTNVDECEINKKLCRELNDIFVENLAGICRVIDCKFVHISTDYLFDGKKGPYLESDSPDPINYYGKCKHAAENSCIVGLEKYAIIRTSSVFGMSSHNKSNFISWIIGELHYDKPVSIINGQYCTPTLTDDIAQCVLKVLLKERYGIYNAAGTSFLNRYELAVKAAKCFGYDKDLISAIMPGELHQKANRPEKAGLVVIKSQTDLNCDFADIDSALFSYRMQLDENQPFYSNFLYN